MRFGTRLLERRTRGSLQSREHRSAALPARKFPARKRLCDRKVWEVHAGLHPSRNLAHINLPPSFILKRGRSCCPARAGGTVWVKALYNPWILDQTSTVAGGVKKKLKQAETNCLITIPSQGYFASEGRDRPLGGLKENRFLTGDLESAVFLRARGRNHDSLQTKIVSQKVAVRRDPQNYSHDSFQHWAGNIKCVWVYFILLRPAHLPWFVFLTERVIRTPP